MTLNNGLAIFWHPTVVRVRMYVCVCGGGWGGVACSNYLVPTRRNQERTKHIKTGTKFFDRPKYLIGKYHVS